MKTNQLRSLAAVSVLWLAVGAGCRKDPPDPGPQLDPLSCNDGTCCGRDKITYEFIEYLSNEPADLGGPPTFSNWGIDLKEAVPHGSPYVTTALSVCDLSTDEVRGLLPTYTIDTYLNPTYKYRVWEKVYGLKGIIGTDPIPILDFYVDSIKVAP